MNSNGLRHTRTQCFPPSPSNIFVVVLTFIVLRPNSTRAIHLGSAYKVVSGVRVIFAIPYTFPHYLFPLVVLSPLVFFLFSVFPFLLFVAFSSFFLSSFFSFPFLSLVS